MTQWAAVERGEEQPSPAAAASALQWWIEAGVDIIVDEAPRDWLRPAPAAEAAPATPEPAANARQPERAPLPDQIDLFRAWLATSEDLSFARPEAPRICPAGDPASGLMILADMPSQEDCGAGVLLSGEVGRLFDRMLAAIGRDRASVYLAALSCLRSPGGSFTQDSSRECAVLARHHIGLVQPKALLLLGDVCAKALTGLSVAQGRGRWHEVATHSGPVKAIVTPSPARLLDRPAWKRLAWADLQLLMEGLSA